MGPEDSEKREIKVYMMVDGQGVEVKPDFAEITYTGEQRRDGNVEPNEWEFSVQLRLPKYMR